MLIRSLIGLLIGAALFCAVGANAQPFPNRPITLVIPLAPGDAGDIAARAIGEELGKALGVSIVPANRPGAGGGLATEQVARAPSDGYTLLYTQNSSLTVRPVTEPEATKYDALTDLTPLALAFRSPIILAVRSDSPYRDFHALVDASRQRKLDIRVGTPGVGSVGDFSVAAINAMTKTTFTAVPFKGASPALNALQGGHLDAVVLTLGVLAPPVQAGTIRALAASDRVVSLPDVPTAADLGIPDGMFGVWFSFLGPAALPASVTERLVAAIRVAVLAPGVAARLAPLGVEQAHGTPEELRERIRREQAALTRLKGQRPQQP